MATVQSASCKPLVPVYHGSSLNCNSQPSIALDKVRQREIDLSHLEYRWTLYCLYHIPRLSFFLFYVAAYIVLLSTNVIVSLLPGRGAWIVRVFGQKFVSVSINMIPAEFYFVLSWLVLFILANMGCNVPANQCTLPTDFFFLNQKHYSILTFAK